MATDLTPMSVITPVMSRATSSDAAATAISATWPARIACILMAMIRLRRRNSSRKWRTE